MPTTLITGASSGIGLELAKQFAAGGDDVVIVARSEEKLRDLAELIRSTYSVQATVVCSDLAKHDAVDHLCDELEQRSITIDNLVNNAGFGALGEFVKLSAERQTDMLMVNVVAMTRLTRRLLPAMLQRGMGGVLNVGSIAAYQAGPGMAVYYASKAYVLSFTEALHEELNGTGLRVTCLEPGPTTTGFGDDSGMSNLAMFNSQAMSAADVAEAGYRAFQKNSDVVIPGWKNRVMRTSAGFLPRFVTRKITARVHRS